MLIIINFNTEQCLWILLSINLKLEINRGFDKGTGCKTMLNERQTKQRYRNRGCDVRSHNIAGLCWTSNSKHAIKEMIRKKELHGATRQQAILNAVQRRTAWYRFCCCCCQIDNRFSLRCFSAGFCSEISDRSVDFLMCVCLYCTYRLNMTEIMHCKIRWCSLTPMANYLFEFYNFLHFPHQIFYNRPQL